MLTWELCFVRVCVSLSGMQCWGEQLTFLEIEVIQHYDAYDMDFIRALLQD